ncbi:MAG: 1-deoxy-D-xylulose-5-phosphate synthase, partial [Paludibacteraceae bacterium]|nr:1-deoxy-D-xylulose-5-phosphate synthase [Paludibacteraceae bacterium]
MDLSATQYLQYINSPKDLKNLSVGQLPVVCDELRQYIIDQLSQHPGHLASSLGVVELTVAIHYVFDTPEDRLVWDVGHQAYAHKILTGRRDRFNTLRQYGGLSGFPTPHESEYDSFGVGHSSTSISAGLGMSVAARLQGKKKRQVVAVIGDGSMTGGLAFEGLNNTSMDKNNMLIVLNDNHIAIDPIKGGFTQYLVDLTTSPTYNRLRYKFYRLMVRMHMIDESKRGRIQSFNNNLKTFLTKQRNNIFDGLNVRYFGPADGHDVCSLVRILQEIKNHKGPKVLHVITKKGKGYKPAEDSATIWHAPGEFNVQTGERIKTPVTEQTPPLYQEVFGQTLLELARQNERIVGITPAMPSGCSMNIMQQELPDRVFDVGIAEGHAVTFSAGLAKDGMIPFCNIYSSFMQRAYDNVIHDVALQHLPVVLCLDRAGIVGADGATHHGLFDLSYMRVIPGLVVAAPYDEVELRNLMYTAQLPQMQCPIVIRYPRGRGTRADWQKPFEPIQIGQGRCLKQGEHIAVLTIGTIGHHAADAIRQVENEQPGVRIAHYDMRFVKPLDEQL